MIGWLGLALVGIGIVGLGWYARARIRQGDDWHRKVGEWETEAVRQQQNAALWRAKAQKWQTSAENWRDLYASEKNPTMASVDGLPRQRFSEFGP